MNHEFHFFNWISWRACWGGDFLIFSCHVMIFRNVSKSYTFNYVEHNDIWQLNKRNTGEIQGSLSNCSKAKCSSKLTIALA